MEKSPAITQGILRNTINWYWLIGFILLGCLEYLLFRNFSLKEITPYYPFGFDQSSYLPIVYKLYTAIKQQGLIQGLLNSPYLATGLLFPIQTAWYFILTSPSRLNALTINLIYYLILQLTTFIAARHLFKGNNIAIAILGVVLMLSIPFFKVGGLFDFRMDFMAFCLYGILIACILMSDLFLSRKWTVALGFIAGFIILSRTILFVYLGIIFFLLLIWLLTSLCKNKSQAARWFIQKRLVNLIMCALITLLITLPVLWVNKTVLYNYYVIGHIIGQEKFIRKLSVGITSLYTDIIFYPLSLLDKLGRLATDYMVLTLLSAFGLFLVSLKQRLYQPVTSNAVDTPGNKTLGITLYFLISTLLVPLLILTLDDNKSTVVGSILVPPIIWLWAYILVQLLGKLSHYIKCIALIAWLSLGLGIGNQVVAYTRFSNSQHQQELQQINSMYLDIGDYAINKKWPKVTLALDKLTDEITSGNLRTLYYEYRGILLKVVDTPLGGQIFSISKQQALASLEKSNVVILTQDNAVAYNPFPFDASIKPIEATLQSYTQNHFKVLGKYTFDGKTASVYVRP